MQQIDQIGDTRLSPTGRLLLQTDRDRPLSILLLDTCPSCTSSTVVRTQLVQMLDPYRETCKHRRLSLHEVFLRSFSASNEAFCAQPVCTDFKCKNAAGSSRDLDTLASAPMRRKDCERNIHLIFNPR